MNQKSLSILTIAFGLALTLTTAGCGESGPASAAPVHIDAKDMAKTQINRANSFLDNLEKLDPSKRQLAASAPQTMTALKDAAKVDPATQQRIESLGIKLAN